MFSRSRITNRESTTPENFGADLTTFVRSAPEWVIGPGFAVISPPSASRRSDNRESSSKPGRSQLGRARNSQTRLTCENAM